MCFRGVLIMGAEEKKKKTEKTRSTMQRPIESRDRTRISSFVETTFERSIANGSKGKGLSDFATHQGYARREREQHRDLILTLLSHTCLLREE